MITTNFHTHSTFCDGKDTPEEMVLAAIDKGFTSLGFSSHSYLFEDRDYTMSPENEPVYRKTINELKEKYKSQIIILCGIEQDIFSAPAKNYDYIIGSVHNVQKNGKLYSVDASASFTEAAIKDAFDSSFENFAEEYFKTVSKVVEKTNADIIGHIDLISKFNEQNGYTQTPAYLSFAEKAVKELVKTEKPFEINTGAIARGIKTLPYPSPEILKMIYSNGGEIIFSSDCHDKRFIDCYFDKALQLARDIGFRKQAIITEKGTEYIKL